jgi:iron complex transport system permease protein
MEYIPSDSYSKFSLGQRRKYFVLIFMGLFAALAVAMGLWSGGESFSPGALPGALMESPIERNIFLSLRLPRIVIGILVGAGLAMSGVLAQAVLRNPLASPFTLGISSGAAFGATLSIFWGVISLWVMAASSFLFAALTSAGILTLAKIKNSRPETMVLGGVAIMFLFAAATSLLQYLATEYQVQAMVFWGFGNLGRAGWTEVGVAAAMILLPVPVALRLSWDLNTLAVGEETAASLGANVHRLRLTGIVLIALMAAGSICFTGLIGFVGLVAPHIARMCLGAEHRFLLPGAAFFGIGLVTISDALARSIWAPQVVPIGIITSFLGVPFFFWLLLRNTKEHWQ